MRSQISQDQVEQYHKDGAITVEGVYDSAFIETLRRVTDEFVEKSRSVTEHTDVYDLEPSHSAEHPRLRRLKSPAEQHEVYKQALQYGPMLDIVAQLIGPAIRYQNTKLNLKSGEFGSAVEWHQDIAFYPHTNEDVLAVGIALDDMTIENGALMVIPGAHRDPLYCHHDNGYFVGAINDSRFSTAGAVPLQIKAGGISIHHSRIPHGSLPNHSNKIRRLLLLEFRAVDAWPILGVKDWDAFNGQILRGEPTNTPRMEPIPVYVPLPQPPTGGSIYEVQTHMSARPLATQ